MEASQLLHRCISSALLVFAILWLCTVVHRYVHTASEARWKFPWLLYSCALTCVCDLILLVLNELQLREEGIYRSCPLYFAAERLTQLRK
jgi:hypothetical protein